MEHSKAITGAAVYLPIGENINISVPGSGTTCTENKLAFTYMNAGFTGYYADRKPETDASKTISGVDKTLNMSVFTITNDMITVSNMMPTIFTI